MAKIIPGEEAVTHAVKLGSHIAERSAASAQARVADAEAGRAAANSDPTAWAEGERHRKNRTLGQTAIKAGAVLTGLAIVVGGIDYGIQNFTSLGRDAATAVAGGLNNIAEAAKPHQLSIAEVETTLDTIEWDPTTGLLQGQVTGAGHIHTENHVLWFDQAGGASDTYSNRRGMLKLGSNNATFTPVELGPNNFQLHVSTSPKDFNVDLTDPYSLSHDVAYDGAVRSAVGSIRGTNGDVRQEKLNDLTDRMMESQCVANFKPALRAAIVHEAYRELNKQLSLLKNIDDKVGVLAIESMLKNPIIVEFEGVQDEATIDLSALAPEVPTKEKLAQDIGSDPEYTQINPATDRAGSTGIDCKDATKAADQLIALANTEQQAYVAAATTQSKAQVQGN